MIDEININSTVYSIHFTKETVPESFRDVSDDSVFAFGAFLVKAKLTPLFWVSGKGA